MPIYDVSVYVRVSAESEKEAYSFIKHACNSARKQEVEYLDAEVTATEPDENDLDPDEYVYWR